MNSFSFVLISLDKLIIFKTLAGLILLSLFCGAAFLAMASDVPPALEDYWNGETLDHKPTNAV